jgi:hypothetical protein
VLNRLILTNKLHSIRKWLNNSIFSFKVWVKNLIYFLHISHWKCSETFIKFSVLLWLYWKTFDFFTKILEKLWFFFFRYILGEKWVKNKSSCSLIWKTGIAQPVQVTQGDLSRLGRAELEVAATLNSGRTTSIWAYVKLSFQQCLQW